MKQKTAVILFFISISLFFMSCNENNYSFHYKNGIAKYNLKDYKGAIEDLNKSIALKANDADALYCRAICFIETNQPEKALSDFDKVIELDPSFEEAYINRAFYIKDKKGDYKGAIEDYNKYLEITKDGDVSYALNNRGFAKYKLELYPEAISDIQESILMNPDNSFAFKNLAVVYLAIDSLNLACENLQKSLDLGFTEKFGAEVQELINTHCIN